MMASRTMNGKNGPFTPPRFSHVYRLKTILEENSKGSWHGWEMSVEGPVQSVDIYQRAKSFAASISLGDVQVKHSDESASPAAQDDDIPF